MITIHYLNVPIFVYKVKNHLEIKEKILSDIEKMGKHSVFEYENKISISNTDWYLPSNRKRPYINHVKETMDNVVNNLKENLHINHDINLTNFWFQQYEKNGCHELHHHGDSFYNNVYYVELPKDGAKTTFNILNKEYEFNVEEGDVISFPGFLFHESKPNMSEERKTVVVFNTVLGNHL